MNIPELEHIDTCNSDEGFSDFNDQMFGQQDHDQTENLKPAKKESELKSSSKDQQFSNLTPGQNAVPQH